jgi:arsenate reductase-like glutaredoxin family protein
VPTPIWRVGTSPTVRETVNASKERYGRADLSKLFADASKVVVAKGKKVHTFDMKKDAPSAADLAAVVLGPTGNLRAPSAKTGKTWVIGFNEEAYGQRFG